MKYKTDVVRETLFENKKSDIKEIGTKRRKSILFIEHIKGERKPNGL